VPPGFDGLEDTDTGKLTVNFRKLIKLLRPDPVQRVSEISTLISTGDRSRQE
jgi:hypothetical protein